MLAIPCTTVQKNRRDDHLDHLDEGVAEGLHLLTELWVEMAEQDAERDRRQDLEVETFEERLMMDRQCGCCALDCHGAFSLVY